MKSKARVERLEQASQPVQRIIVLFEAGDGWRTVDGQLVSESESQQIDGIVIKVVYE